MAPDPSVLGCGHCCLGCVKETGNRARPFLRVAHSNPWDTPWTPTPGSGAVDQPQSRKHQRKSNASYSAPTNHSSVLWPPPPWHPHCHHHCFLSQKRLHILSFIIFILTEMTLYKFSSESFSIVSSYIAQFRNLSETDSISNPISKDHIHVYVVTRFDFIGLTRDCFSDANCVPSGLAETVLDFSVLDEVSHGCINWTV